MYTSANKSRKQKAKKQKMLTMRMYNMRCINQINIKIMIFLRIPNK